MKTVEYFDGVIEKDETKEYKLIKRVSTSDTLFLYYESIEKVINEEKEKLKNSILGLNETVDVANYSSSLSSEIQFFKNDAVDLVFSIYEFGIEVKPNGISKARTMPINPLKAKLLIETPYGVDSVESASIVENEVMFKLDEIYTQNIGKSKMQIVLLDEENYKITLPEFSFEIKKSINEKWDGEDVIYPTILLADDGSVILADEATALIR